MWVGMSNIPTVPFGTVMNGIDLEAFAMRVLERVGAAGTLAMRVMARAGAAA